MAAPTIVSADSHVYEPADLFVEYIDPEYRSRAPRIVRHGDVDKWQLEGVPLRNVGLVTAAGMRPEEIRDDIRHEEGRRGGWDPHARVEDMDVDGVDAEVLYPSLFPMFRIPDKGLKSASLRAYNDWLADMCAAYPDRLIGIGLIHLHDIEAAVQELRRVAGKGLRGVGIHSLPPDERPFGDPVYDPFWAEAQDTRTPISLHLFTHDVGERAQPKHPMASYVTAPVEVQEALATLIGAGVLERFPELKFISVEADIGWMPTFLARMDHYFQRHRFHRGTSQDLTMAPSDYFHRQVYATFIQDKPGVDNRHHIGVENIMWSSDYPHSDSTWPESRKFIDLQFGGLPEEDRRKIICDNAAGLYHLG